MWLRVGFLRHASRTQHYSKLEVCSYCGNEMEEKVLVVVFFEIFFEKIILNGLKVLCQILQYCVVTAASEILNWF